MICEERSVNYDMALANQDQGNMKHDRCNEMPGLRVAGKHPSTQSILPPHLHCFDRKIKQSPFSAAGKRDTKLLVASVYQYTRVYTPCDCPSYARPGVFTVEP